MKPLSILLLGVLLTGVQAAERDPTAAPPELVQGALLPGAPGAVLQGSNVIVRDGQPHLVVGTRLVAVGQTVGEARLERITETEIWLREGKQLRKLPRFAGIQRSSARVADTCPPKPAPHASGAGASVRKPVRKPSSVPTPVVSCDGVTP